MMKKNMALFVALALFLCMLSSVALANNLAGSLSDMRFSVQDNGDVLLTWKDKAHNGPYKVLFKAAGWEVTFSEESSYSSCRALLEYLIPSETYTVAVMDSNNGILVEEYTVPDPPYTEFNVGGKYLTMTETEFSLSALKKNPSLTTQVKVSWPRLKKSREYTAKLALKTPLGYSHMIYLEDKFTFENDILNKYWVVALMDEWLEPVKTDFGRIPTGKYTFEIYMDGRLYDYVSFRVKN